MRIPRIKGLIKRRILANFRADPEVTQRLLPPVFKPKLQAGHAIIGICLIRLENIRPLGLPGFLGISSENAAHRFAVTWEDGKGEAREGVYIARRDTSSWFNHLAGGRLFPGEHEKADFQVSLDRGHLDFRMHSADGKSRIVIKGRKADALPADSCFACLGDASDFFRGGSTGFSVTRDPKRLDGVILDIKRWEVSALDVQEIHASFYTETSRFPPGALRFDNALLMENIEHEWHGTADMSL